MEQQREVMGREEGNGKERKKEREREREREDHAGARKGEAAPVIPNFHRRRVIIIAAKRRV